MLFVAAILLGALHPRAGQADGILEAINFNEEIVYSLLSTTTTDAFGTTTTDTTNLSSRTNVRLNYNLLPKLNLNAGGSYDRNLSEASGDGEDSESTITRIRPYVWLNLRDPVFGAAVGYDLADETVETGQGSTTLTRDTYNGVLTWRPLDLPATQFRYTRTWTRDEERTSLDTTQDQFFLKSEYTYRGLNAHYAGTYLTTSDQVAAFESRQTTHEGKLLYATAFLDGRMTMSTDHRIRRTELETDRGALGIAALDTGLAFQLSPVRGLSSTDSAINIELAPSPELLNGNARVNLQARGDPRLRQVGLDFGRALTLNRLRVTLCRFVQPDQCDRVPDDIVISADIYTSTNGRDWALLVTGAPVVRRPFETTGDIVFSNVTTQFIKAVFQPLVDPLRGDIFITTLQAFIDPSVQGGASGRRTETITQTVRTHNVDVRTVLLRAPFFYHRLSADFLTFDPDGEERYNVSNGLFLTQRLGRIFSLNANASYEIGQERNQARTGVLYYAALAATPLPTLTDSLVVSGNRQWGAATTTSDSVVLYNTAQLYRGIDGTLNLGAVFTSEDDDEIGGTARRREYYVNVGTGITPHPSLTLSTYYLGRLTHSSGGATGEVRDTTENRLDLGLSFAPFRTLSVSASASVASQTDQETAVNQSYALNWAPFPDGTMQLAFFYAETLLPDGTQSRIVQPTARWYVGPRRRSYLEATFQLSTTEGLQSKSESQLFSTGLNIAF